MQPQPAVLVVGAAQPEPVYVQPGEVAPAYGKQAAGSQEGRSRRTFKGLLIAALCVGAALGIGLGVGLKASEAAPAPSGQTVTPATVYTVSSSLTLAGMTASTFSSAARSAFTSSVASTLGVQASAVNVTQVTDITTARRRALAIGIAVNFTITTTSVSAQQAVSTSITTIATSSSALQAFTTALNAALTAAGAPTVTVGGLSTPVLASTTVVAPSPPPALPPPATSPSPGAAPTPSAGAPASGAPASGGSGIVFNLNQALGIAVPGAAPPPQGRRHLLAAVQMCCSQNNVTGCPLNSTCPSAVCPGNSTMVVCSAVQNVSANPCSCGSTPPGGQNPVPPPNAPPPLASAPVLAVSPNASLSNAVTQNSSDTNNQLGTISQVFTFPPLNLSVYATWSQATTFTKINGTRCLLLMVNATTGAPSCLHTSAVTSIMQRNTNSGQNPGFGDDVQFDVSGNVYYVGAGTNFESLYRVNVLASGGLVPTALFGRSPAGDVSKWAVVSSGSLNGTYIVGGCPYTMPVVNNMLTQNASCGSRAYSPAQTLLYRIASESFVWSVANNDGNFYLGFIPNGGCEQLGCNPPPGVYQYVPGSSGLTPAAVLASNLTNGGQCTSATCNGTCTCVPSLGPSLYPTGASPQTPAAPNTTIQAACPLCDKLSAAFGQGVVKLGNGAIITALPFQYGSLPSPNAYGYNAPTNVALIAPYNNQFGVIQTLFQYYPLPGRTLAGAAQTGGFFQNVSKMTALVNDTMACAGQAPNGTWYTTIFNLTANAHTVVPSATGVKISFLSFSNSANSLFISGTNTTASNAVVLVIVPLANPSNATFANTTGITVPFSSFANF